MTIRQFWKNLTRNYRVKKSIRKIKAEDKAVEDFKRYWIEI